MQLLLEHRDCRPGTGRLRRRSPPASTATMPLTMQIATLPRLARTPTPELIEHLEDAVAAKKLALAEAVRLEFRGRPERERQELRDRYSATFSKLEVPQAAAAKTTIGKIASLAAFGRERFNAATTGRSDPVARMTAARMAAE
jgi:hypothetical protein